MWYIVVIYFAHHEANDVPLLVNLSPKLAKYSQQELFMEKIEWVRKKIKSSFSRFVPKTAFVAGDLSPNACTGNRAG